MFENSRKQLSRQKQKSTESEKISLLNFSANIIAKDLVQYYI